MEIPMRLSFDLTAIINENEEIDLPPDQAEYVRNYIKAFSESQDVMFQFFKGTVYTAYSSAGYSEENKEMVKMFLSPDETELLTSFLNKLPSENAKFISDVFHHKKYLEISDLLYSLLLNISFKGMTYSFGKDNQMSQSYEVPKEERDTTVREE